MMNCGRYERRWKRRCGLPCRLIWSESGRKLGCICAVGHITASEKRARQQCRTCGSRTKNRHATCCQFAHEQITTALVCVEDIAIFRTSSVVAERDPSFLEEAWAAVQEAIEEVLPFGDSRVGGPL